MALHKLASIVVRPRRTWQIAALSVAALTAAGCSHNRQSYRPIYTSPAPVAAPCTNCGGSSSTVSTDEPTGGTVSSVPSLVDHAGIGYARRRHRRYRRPAATTDRRPSSTVEKPPRSRLDDEPGFDETAVAGARLGPGRQQDTPAAAQAG